MRVVSVCRLLIRVQLVAIGFFVGEYAAAEEVSEKSAPVKPTATLITHLGDRLPGHWLATKDLKAIDWQTKGFVGPFQFERERVAAIQFRHEAKVPPIEGTYRCELVNGNVFYGNPLAVDDMELVFEVPGSGELRIGRDRLRKLSPWVDAGQSVSSTPTSLYRWQGAYIGWQESAGRITARQDHAELTSSLQLGEKSQTTIRVAWDGQPDFRIDFGSNDAYDQGLRLETWEKQLVLVAESSDVADVVLVANDLGTAGEFLINVFSYAGKQKILVTDENGNKLGEFSWEEGFGSKFRIQARKKGLHFYSATVTPWDGSSPELFKLEQPSIRFKDGHTEQAAITAWNPDSQEWTVLPLGDTSESEPAERQVSETDIISILWGGKSSNEDAAVQKDLVQAVLRTGMRFTGKIVSLKNHAVELRCKGVKDPITLSLASLQSVVFLYQPDMTNTETSKLPRLQIGAAFIAGHLVEAQVDENDDKQATALVWKPNASRTAAAISNSASGSIVYRKPPPPPVIKTEPTPVQRNPGIVAGIVRLFSGSPAKRAAKTVPSATSSGPTLHLRSGDTIPCEPKRIDARGVTFTSSVTEATFAAKEKIKALVLVSNQQPARVTEEQRDRLLTLPRMQQEYPPTHLLLSVDGDLLRTRVTAMDEKFITTEIRLNSVNLPRERVAAIAWLHQEENQEEGEKSAGNSSDGLLQVQAVRSDGIRLSFHPGKFAEGVLHGLSSVFGKCRVDVSEVDKLLFGRAIQESLKNQSHQLLALKPAIAPRFVTAGEEAATDIGQGSALVGQEAPAILLKDIDGKRFDLSEHRGKVVVLDFWATWCGPCIQWMPQLEEIVGKYSAEEVELVTINLLQEKDAIGPVLERMQMNPTVLLDIDGVVADAYQAISIPQTVIIDQQGEVARVFIGGSPQIKQPLVDVLDVLTSGSAAN